MKTIGVRICGVPFAVAVIVLLQLAPAVSGRAEAQPGQSQRPVDVTFTKWRSAVVPPPPAVPLRSLFAGFVGGDLGAGDFVGEVLERKVSTPCTITAPPCDPGTPPATIGVTIAALDAVYEVQAGEQSFIALIQGGSSGATGAALLDGVILSGWRTGARVHVAFQTISSCIGPDGLVHGPCFDGTIRIERAPDK